MWGVLRQVPLLGVIAAIYLLVAAFAAGTLVEPMTGFNLPSGSSWTFTISDLLVMIGLLALYVEILKATRTSQASVFDHVLSLAVFIACLLCFILVGRAGTTAFALIMLMALIDVIAGFTVTISTARRDIELDRNRL